MFRSGKVTRISLSILLAGAMLFSSPMSITRAAENTDKITMSMIGKYDSADTAAIRDIDTVNKTIRFRNHSTGKTYTLSYDNTSMIYDARGTVLSAGLLEVGQIVDVTFLKSSKHITTLNVSDEAWTIEDTRNHELVRGDGTAKIKGELYKIDARTLIMADGDLALAEDILSTDKVTVSGIGKDIYSVVVTSGHGYVSLSSDTVEDQSLVGAWIELDNEVIYKISPNMLLSAPEGEYNLQILGNGADYQSEVEITRNQETVVDTSAVNITKPKEGLVTFEIIPEDAEVFVDGEKMLTGIPQSIRYGFHNLKLIADGYVTQNKYLKIGTAKSVISIEMEKDSDSATSSSSSASSEASAASVASASASTMDISGTAATVDTSSSSAASSASTVSGNSSSDSASTNKVITGYKIYFDSPYGAELYFDGAYIGMVPISVTKVSGSHEVILKKDGYETKSYRISIDSDEVDLTYTFPDLVKIASDDSSSSSSSASSASSSSSSDSSSDASSAASSDDSSSDASSAEDSGSSSDSSSGSDSSSTDSSSSADASSADSSDSGSSSSAEASSQSGDSSSSSADSSSGSSSSGSSGSGSSEESSSSSSKSEETSDAASTASASST